MYYRDVPDKIVYTFRLHLEIAQSLDCSTQLRNLDFADKPRISDQSALTKNELLKLGMVFSFGVLKL